MAQLGGRMSSTEQYAAWMEKWSRGGSAMDALNNVRKEVDLLTTRYPPPLEVRVAALESFWIMAAEVLASNAHGPEQDHPVETAYLTIEFLRLCHLHDAIVLDRMANEGEG